MQITKDYKLLDTTITGEHLLADMVVRGGDRTIDSVVEKIAKYNQTHIIYHSVFGATHYSEPYHILMKSLVANCDLVSFAPVASNQYLYEFQSCLFIQQ